MLLPLSLLLAAPPAHAERDIRIAGAVYLGDVPTMVADAGGLFADQGLRAEVEHLPSGERSLARLRAGEADFALMALTPVVLDRLADPDPGGPDDPVILASLVHSTNLLGIVAPHASGIERATDFRGRRVAVDRGTNTEFVWWLFEQYHAIDRSTIELVAMPFPEMPDALAAGRVDAAVLWEPWVSRLEGRLERAGEPPLRRFPVRDLYAGKWVLVTTRRHARERAALCRDVLAAYRRAIEFIERGPDEAIAIYNQRVEPVDRIPADQWSALDYDLNLDWTLIAGLQEQFHWARVVGYENADGPVRVLEALAPGPLRDGWPGAVGIPAAPDDAS